MKEKYIEDIKNLAYAIVAIDADNYVSKEETIRTLYDKYILLKYNETHEDKVEPNVSNEIPAIENNKEELQGEKNSIYTITSDKDCKEEAKHEEMLNATSSLLEKKTVEIVSLESSENKSMVSDTVLNQEKKLLAKKLSLDFNDRIGFINMLFDGKSDEFDLILNTINMVNTLQESKNLIANLKERFQWYGEKEEFAERLDELNLKRFE